MGAHNALATPDRPHFRRTRKGDGLRCRRLAAVFRAKLIPFNPTGSAYDGSSREAIERFRNVLVRAGIPATVRLTRGRDIEAACGQLAAEARSLARVVL